MKTTITESKTTYGICGKCGGDGYISSYAHIKAGTCFACSGTGKRLVKIEIIERPMTYSEMVDALSAAGFDIIDTTNGDDFFAYMTQTAEEAAAMMAGVKALLEAIPG